MTRFEEILIAVSADQCNSFAEYANKLMHQAYNMAIDDAAECAKAFLTEDKAGNDVPMVSKGSILSLKITVDKTKE